MTFASVKETDDLLERDKRTRLGRGSVAGVGSERRMRSNEWERGRVSVGARQGWAGLGHGERGFLVCLGLLAAGSWAARQETRGWTECLLRHSGPEGEALDFLG